MTGNHTLAAKVKGSRILGSFKGVDLAVFRFSGDRSSDENVSECGESQELDGAVQGVGRGYVGPRERDSRGGRVGRKGGRKRGRIDRSLTRTIRGRGPPSLVFNNFLGQEKKRKGSGVSPIRFDMI